MRHAAGSRRHLLGQRTQPLGLGLGESEPAGQLVEVPLPGAQLSDAPIEYVRRNLVTVSRAQYERKAAA
ncbi:hypothetical protein [Amycolatopsis cihanbeyliensis]|uniref:hypothetical protein n=1 Tax=Amycolatopsis cihanbeyliensis TaxID=1128664 RepID=UPI00114F5F3E|nr:hypothetical protein [Amycolatopsis cihanbeyliensis]